MDNEAKGKRTKLDTLARIIQIITGLSVISGIIIGFAGLFDAHKQAKLAFRAMKMSSLQYINQLIDNDTNVRLKIEKFIKEVEIGKIPGPKTLFEKYTTGEGVYLSPELSDFRDIFRHYEQMGAKVKLQYIDSDLIFEVIPFPDNYWDMTNELRCRIQYNWYGKGRELKDFGSNFLFLKEFYDTQRGQTSFPYENLMPIIDRNIKKSSQILLVVNKNINSYNAKVFGLEKQQENWRPVFRPMAAFIGENGLVTPEEKKEGDNKTPTGIYPLKRTFGYFQKINSKMPYIQVTDDDIWITDSKSDEYNKLVKKNKTNMTIFENMKRDDNLYEYGIVIEYNTDNVEKGKGSGIFLHVWGWPCTTTGCVALEERSILKILEWLDPAKKPLVIIGSEVTLESILRNYIKDIN